MGDEEARFFTKRLASWPSHPVCECCVCDKPIDACECTYDMMRAWLDAQPKSVTPPQIVRHHHCSRMKRSSK